MDSSSASDTTPEAPCIRPKPIRNSAAPEPNKSAVSKPNAKVPKVKHESPPSGSAASDISVAITTTSDAGALPEFARATWSTSFLPTLYKCLACSSDPFVIGPDLVNVVQEIVNIVYPDSNYQVRSNDKIFTMVRHSFLRLLRFYS